MTPEKIKAAEAEAKRFLARVAEFRKAAPLRKTDYHEYYESAPRESGAVRRASMDLTRALSAMRRPV